MTAGPIRRGASRVLATLVTLLFLFARLPEPPLGWFSRLLLFLVPVLLMPVSAEVGTVAALGRIRPHCNTH
jgi:hypothetical protein